MRNIIGLILLIWCASLSAQKYYTKTGTVTFKTESTMEKIEATTKSANCVIDIPTGAIEMAILINSFYFDKALMQEHFNENYMESTKFPKAMFKGTISNIAGYNLLKNGKYEGKVNGLITIHGQTKSIESKIMFNVIDGSINATTDLKISLADFKIDIPALVKDNIGKTADISVNTRLELLKKHQ